jgi:hypothetical protein
VLDAAYLAVAKAVPTLHRGKELQDGVLWPFQSWMIVALQINTGIEGDAQDLTAPVHSIDTYDVATMDLWGPSPELPQSLLWRISDS